MIWFDRLFPVLMLGHPLVFALLIKTKETGAGDQEVSRLIRRLVVATVFALTLHVAVQIALETTRADRDVLRAGWPVLISVLGCNLLWVLFAGRAMAAKNAAWGGNVVRETPQRSASLAPRHLADPIRPRAWFAGWIVFALCALVTAWSIAAGAPLLLLLGLGWWIGMAVAGAKQNLVEAEPRDASGSMAVADAYRSLRAFRSWCFYWLGLAGTIVFALTAAMVLVWPGASGVLGGVLGTGLGIAGALFGVLASFRRVRINELLLRGNAS